MAQAMLWHGFGCHLPQIRVLEVVEDTPGALVVSVESTLLRLRCAQCGFKCRRVHDRRSQEGPGPGGVGTAHDVGVAAAQDRCAATAPAGFLEDHPCGCRKLCRGWSGDISVLVDESATAGRSNDLEVPIWLVCSVGGDGW